VVAEAAAGIVLNIGPCGTVCGHKLAAERKRLLGGGLNWTYAGTVAPPERMPCCMGDLAVGGDLNSAPHGHRAAAAVVLQFLITRAAYI